MVANILVVEDESIIALDIERSLIDSGYNVVAIATSAETALSAAEEFHPDLVLMDVRIQGQTDGIETASLLQTQFHLPVIYLTAHADEDTLRRIKTTQPFGYVLKPFQDQDLIAAIEVALCRHQAEVEVQKALQKQTELNEMKSRFMAVVSHEFRNPLSAIMVSLNLLEQHEEFLTPEKKQNYLQRAKNSVARMIELLNDVLLIGEAELSGLQGNLAPLDLSQFCRELSEEFQFSSGSQYNICFLETRQGSTASDTANLPAALPYLDERLLRHILTNLLSNAIKYSPAGGNIILELIYCPDQLIFRVQDQGIGIPDSDQAHLFNSFHRGSNVSSIAGTGLGLSIVKQCVESLGGTISVESQVGAGSTFNVTLPLKHQKGKD